MTEIVYRKRLPATALETHSGKFNGHLAGSLADLEVFLEGFAALLRRN